MTQAAPPPPDPSLEYDVLALAFRFESVRSEADCLSLMAATQLLTDQGVSKFACEVLENICRVMRDKGMAMEPNLIGRAAARSILDRSLAGSVSITFASADTDFLELITLADTARDQGQYSDAEQRYLVALKMFPCHPGYLVQRGHCLKECQLRHEALASYLDALRFGAPLKDVEVHALHLGGLIGQHDEVANVGLKNTRKPDDRPPSPLDWALTSSDVVALTHLFHLHLPSPELIIKRMCEHHSRRDLILALLHAPQFARSHRSTLRLISETGLR